MKILSRLTVAAFAALSLAGAAQAQVVTSSEWAGTDDDGGLGGQFVFLNSSGVDPLSILSAWDGDWSPPDVVFDADFDGPGNFSNSDSWDQSSFIHSFGFPDTTTYGQTFIAPSATLNGWDFLINLTNTGNKARFVIANWDANAFRATTALYSADVTLASGGYQWTDNGLLNVSLEQGGSYVAYLTVADVGGAIPEPATWALMIGGFGLAGAVLRRRRVAA